MVQVFLNFTDHRLNTTVLKRRFQVGEFDQVQERLATSSLAESEIIGPCGDVILAVLHPKLERADLCQRIINVIKGRIENMALFMPKATQA